MTELTKRILSGIVLAAALLGVLWLGSWWFAVALGLGGLVVFREYVQLIWLGWTGPVARGLWLILGALYIGAAGYGLWLARSQEEGFFAAMLLFVAVWATDVGAFIAGRAIGGPKIAPRISPSKTWAGYGGAIVATSIVVFTAVSWQIASYPWDWGLYINLWGVLLCAVLAAIAQAGDFLESWLKRRAGVKDSGTLIPGHGGLFDRVDGLLPVAAIFPLVAQIALPT